MRGKKSIINKKRSSKRSKILIPCTKRLLGLNSTLWTLHVLFLWAFSKLSGDQKATLKCSILRSLVQVVNTHVSIPLAS